MKQYLVVVEYDNWEGEPTPWTQAQPYDSLDDAIALMEIIIHDHEVWQADEDHFGWDDSPDFVYADGYIHGFWEDYSEVSLFEKV